MSAAPDSAEQRKLRSVARRYERDGYRVSYPGRGGSTPTFLQGFTPDLIAESDWDRVIVEIKRSDAIRGSNELREVAERVSREPGWRFELVAIEPIEEVTPPTEEQVDLVEGRARKAMGLGLPEMAYFAVWEFIEALLGDLARQQGLFVTKMPLMKIMRELVSRGVISRETFSKVEQAYYKRNRLAHGPSWDDQLEMPPSAEVEELLALARLLQGDFANTAAS